MLVALLEASLRLRSRTDAIVVHCTASKFGVDQTMDDIRAGHLARGFSDIGYAFVIDLLGYLQVGRPDSDAVGSHVKNFNNTTVGVSYVGGLGPDGKPADTRTPKQTETLIFLLKALCKRYPKAVILGHRDLSPDMDNDGVVEKFEWLKECPCFDAGPWAKSVELPGARYSRGRYIRL